ITTLFVELVRLLPERGVEDLTAGRNQPGMCDPGPVEPVGRLTLLVPADPLDRRGTLRGVTGRDERGHATDRVCTTTVASTDQQLGVGTHERHRHGDLRPVRQYRLRTRAHEILDDAENVVPASGIETGDVFP